MSYSVERRGNRDPGIDNSAVKYRTNTKLSLEGRVLGVRQSPGA